MKRLGVFGAGGCGRGILPLVRESATGEDVVFVDDRLAGTKVNGADVIDFDSFAAMPTRQICIAIAHP